MTKTDDHNEDDIALVGEYALHLLDAEDRLSFKRRLKTEPHLRSLLQQWDEGLVCLTDDILPQAPPAHIKAGIDARLFPQRKKHGFSFANLFGLRGSLVALGCLVAVAFYLVPPLFDDPNGPIYLAEIAAQDRALVVQARFDADGSQVTITRTTGIAAQGRVLELWLIAKGASAPVSLGVLPLAQQARVIVPEDLQKALEGGTLAISDEPPGGSPTGAPTGPVLAVGAIISS